MKRKRGRPVTLSLEQKAENQRKRWTNFLGWKKRETDYAVQHGRIPVFRIGVKIHARKSELRARLTAG
jgi:hypothetical protein